MHLLALLRKIIKVIFTRNCKKKERPSSLHEYLDAGTEHRRGRRRYCVILLIAPALYCLFSGNTYYSETRPPPPVPLSALYEVKIAINKSGKPSVTTIAPSQPTTKKVCLKERKPRQPKKKKPLCVTAIKFEVITPQTTLNFSAKNLFPEVTMGGCYTPKTCKSEHKVCIIVPYRDRTQNLSIFLLNMHAFLMKQNVEYCMYLVEQAGRLYPFNKGRLFNAGVKEIMKIAKWDCIIFHDVDLLPLNLAILYTCPTFPRHMCAGITNRKYKPLNHKLLFGGVTAMSVHHYQRVNGYSNLYWGWGGEDNDMFWRIRSLGYPLMRYNKVVGQYLQLPHKEQPQNEYRYQVLEASLDRYKVDGLSNVEYKVLQLKYYHLYTHITVDVNPKRLNITYFYQKYFAKNNKHK